MVDPRFRDLSQFPAQLSLYETKRYLHCTPHPERKRDPQKMRVSEVSLASGSLRRVGHRKIAWRTERQRRTYLRERSIRRHAESADFRGESIVAQ